MTDVVNYDPFNIQIVDESNEKEVKLRIPSMLFEQKDWNVELKGNILVVTAKQTKEIDTKKIERNFEFKKRLPPNANTDGINARFTLEGVLMIEGPLEKPTQRQKK